MLYALLRALRIAIFNQGCSKIHPRPRERYPPPSGWRRTVPKSWSLYFLHTICHVSDDLWGEKSSSVKGSKNDAISIPWPMHSHPWPAWRSLASCGQHDGAAHVIRLNLQATVFVSITRRTKKQLAKAQTPWSGPSGFRKCLHASQCRFRRCSKVFASLES